MQVETTYRISSNYGELQHIQSLQKENHTLAERINDRRSKEANSVIKRQISVHEPSGNIVITVTDKNTGEIIREIPQREMLDLKARIKEMAGLIFDKRI